MTTPSEILEALNAQQISDLQETLEDMGAPSSLVDVEPVLVDSTGKRTDIGRQVFELSKGPVVETREGFALHKKESSPIFDLWTTGEHSFFCGCVSRRENIDLAIDTHNEEVAALAASFKLHG